MLLANQYRDFAREVKGNLVFDFDHSSVTLADINMNMLTQMHVILT